MQSEKSRDRSNEGKIIGCILYPDSKRGNFNSAEILNDLWNFYSESCDVAYILHDKDTDKDGNLKKAHYHFIIRSRSTFSKKAFQEKWHLSGHCCEILDRWDSSVQYLAHLNPGESNDGNYKYDIKEIKANFPLDKYFNSLKSADPEYIQILKILNWASKNKANYYQILKYAGDNGYFSAYRKSYKMIYDILGSKPWLMESDIVDLDMPREVLKF